MFQVSLPYIEKNLISNKYNLASRIHKLVKYPIYVKREDELLFGTKLRKYSSLIPYLQKNGHKKVILLGGKYSNNICNLSQILTQNQIEPFLYLKGENESKLFGNHLLTNLFVKKENIKYIKRSEYDKLVIEEPYFVIKEGSSLQQSMPGLMTLTDDILRNERENNLEFNHIFVDSGTGMSSISLILGFSLLKKLQNFKIHVVQISELDYKEKIEKFKLYLKETSNITQYVDYQVYPSLQNFGNIKKNKFSFIKSFAQEEGILLDPIYNSNLFEKSFEIINSEKLTGNILIIHSGGLSSLFGFQNQLELAVKE